jgi:hypothetical protein
MNLSAIDLVLWGAGFLGNAVLFAILMVRHRWREFSAFTAYIGFQATWSLVLYAAYQYGSRVLYARVYWSATLLDFALQLGVIWEIARIVMRPTGSWVRDARRQFILGGVAGLLLAAALSWMISPPAATLLDCLTVRGSFFTSLVICELFVVILLTSKRLGLGYRNHVFALVLGWSGWVMAAMLVDLLHGYYGTRLYYDALSDGRKFAYLAALGYWMHQFWKEEPARREISPELRAYILSLHGRIKKDIDTLHGYR